MRAARHLMVLALVTLSLVAAACGGDSLETTEAPGFAGKDKAVDRSPFELVEPKTDAETPTTLEGSDPTLPLPSDIARRVRPGDPSGTTTTTSTTTTIVPTTTMPNAPLSRGRPTSFCGASDYLYSLISIFTNPRLDVEAIGREAPPLIEQYRKFGPPEVAAEVDLVFDTVLVLIAQLAAADFDVPASGVLREVEAIIDGAPKYAEFVAAFTRMQFVEVLTCQTG